jgi:hypothetical protein
VNIGINLPHNTGGEKKSHVIAAFSVCFRSDSPPYYITIENWLISHRETSVIY